MALGLTRHVRLALPRVICHTMTAGNAAEGFECVPESFSPAAAVGDSRGVTW